MQPENAHFVHGGFSRFADLYVDIARNFFYRFFDARRMNTPVGNEPFQRYPRDFSADGIEPGQYNHFRRIVDDKFDARGVFESADIAPLSADDAGFHIVAGERHHRYGEFGSLISRAFLNGKRNNLLRVDFRFVFGLLFHFANGFGCFAAGVVENFFRKRLFRLVAGELRHAFEFLHHEFVLRIQLLLQSAQLFFVGFDFRFLLVQRFDFFIERVFFLR